MRILKYILLLILLFSIAFVVFVATQNSEYKVLRSKEIKIEKDIVFTFVNDSTNLELWSPWKSNEAYFKNINIIPNDSLVQNISFSEAKSESLMILKQTTNGILLSWEVKGKLNFNLKLLSVIQGGVENVIGDKLDEGLNNINEYLVKELKTYKIQINGLVTKHTTNYIQQIDTCSIEDFQKVSKSMLKNMLSFVTDNQIEILGLPFITYENPTSNNKEIIFAMCVPVEEEILTTPGSEISGGHFDEFLAVKTTLVGDYSHREEAWKKTREYVIKNKLLEDPSKGKYIEVYKISLPKERKPSKWITELYVPVKKKVFKPKAKPKTEEIEVEIQNSNENATVNPTE